MAHERVHLFRLSQVIDLDGTTTCLTPETGESRVKCTYVNLVVQCANVHVLAVCAPADGRDRTTYLENRNACLVALLAAFPYPHRPIIRACRNQLNASATSHCPVEGIDDSAMCAYFLDALASGNIRHIQNVVRADCIESRGVQRPLQVEDRRFVQTREQSVIRVRRVCPPKRCRIKIISTVYETQTGKSRTDTSIG